MGAPGERLVDACVEAGVVGFDTMVFIYHFQDDPRYAPVTADVLRALEEGLFRGVASTLLLTELLVHPLRAGAAAEARDIYVLLTSFPNLDLVAPDSRIAFRAAELRAEGRLRTPDALHLATSAERGAAAFLTNDRRLRSSAIGLRVLMLDGDADA